jgi:hypothetical protein
MTSRWFSLAVVLFWVTSMSWLIHDKILPPLIVGEPPSFRTILEHQQQRTEPVGWAILVDDKPVGWAISVTERQPTQIGEFRSRLHLNRLPLSEMLGEMARLLPAQGRDAAAMALDANSRLEIDPLGRPIAFQSTAVFRSDEVRFPRNPFLDASAFRISVKGTVEGSQMILVLRIGDFVREASVYIPSNSLMGDVLSPQNFLPNLRVGQTWTVPVYSPFRPPTSPIEILQANVESIDPIVWQNTVTPTSLVIYRTDSGAGHGGAQDIRGKTWVKLDGMVVKQEVNLLSARLAFLRMTTEETRTLVAAQEAPP